MRVIFIVLPDKKGGLANKTLYDRDHEVAARTLSQDIREMTVPMVLLNVSNFICTLCNELTRWSNDSGLRDRRFSRAVSKFLVRLKSYEK